MFTTVTGTCACSEDWGTGRGDAYIPSGHYPSSLWLFIACPPVQHFIAEPGLQPTEPAGSNNAIAIYRLTSKHCPSYKIFRRRCFYYMVPGSADHKLFIAIATQIHKYYTVC